LKAKLIIVEGVDGSGKTTLIENLKRALWIDWVFNYSYPREATEAENKAYAKGEQIASIRIFKILLAAGHSIICDRFHLGDWAYGPVKRGYKDLNLYQKALYMERLMIRELGRENIRLVVLALPGLEAMERLKQKPDFKDEYVKDPRELATINFRYVFFKSELRYNIIATEGASKEEVAERAIRFITGE